MAWFSWYSDNVHVFVVTHATRELAALHDGYRTKQHQLFDTRTVCELSCHAARLNDVSWAFKQCYRLYKLDWIISPCVNDHPWYGRANNVTNTINWIKSFSHVWMTWHERSNNVTYIIKWIESFSHAWMAWHEHSNNVTDTINWIGSSVYAWMTWYERSNNVTDIINWIESFSHVWRPLGLAQHLALAPLSHAIRQTKNAPCALPTALNCIAHTTFPNHHVVKQYVNIIVWLSVVGATRDTSAACSRRAPAACPENLGPRNVAITGSCEWSKQRRSRDKRHVQEKTTGE